MWRYNVPPQGARDRARRCVMACAVAQGAPGDALVDTATQTELTREGNAPPVCTAPIQESSEIAHACWRAAAGKCP
jgi:hypothetical protein